MRQSAATFYSGTLTINSRVTDTSESSRNTPAMKPRTHDETQARWQRELQDITEPVSVSAYPDDYNGHNTTLYHATNTDTRTRAQTSFRTRVQSPIHRATPSKWSFTVPIHTSPPLSILNLKDPHTPHLVPTPH